MVRLLYEGGQLDAAAEADSRPIKLLLEKRQESDSRRVYISHSQAKERMLFSISRQHPEPQSHPTGKMDRFGFIISTKAILIDDYTPSSNERSHMRSETHTPQVVPVTYFFHQMGEKDKRLLAPRPPTDEDEDSKPILHHKGSLAVSRECGPTRRSDGKPPSTHVLSNASRWVQYSREAP